MLVPLNPNLGGGGRRGVILPHTPCWFSLNNSAMVEAVSLAFHFAAFSNILLKTFMPNLVSLTCSSLQILNKSQTGVCPISAFLFNPL